MRENRTILTIRLADNETDRDYERFSVSALYDMARLYVGKTGVIGEDANGKTQQARILSCEVKTKPDKLTKSGEIYTYLEARAMINNTSENLKLLSRLETKEQEGSVSCSVMHKICSVCGEDFAKYPCEHTKGKIFNGKPAVMVLYKVTEVYEWAIVRPPEVSASAKMRVRDVCKVLSCMMSNPCAACELTDLCETCVFNAPSDCTNEEKWIEFFRKQGV